MRKVGSEKSCRVEAPKRSYVHLLHGRGRAKTTTAMNSFFLYLYQIDIKILRVIRTTV